MLLTVILILCGMNMHAQKEILQSFKPSVDSVNTLALEHFRVKPHIRLNKVMKRGGFMDLYFTKELSDLPWRPGDAEWFCSCLKMLWPEDLAPYRLGMIFCESLDLEELQMQAPGNDGKAGRSRITVKAPARDIFIEKKGGLKFDRGLTGRYIALWQSHGRFYDEGAGCWSWQRSPNWRTVEDIYTQSYVLPFLIPMLERAGAYVMTPRERDTGMLEVICDNDQHFSSSGYPVRIHGKYSEKGSWKDAGEGFADRKEVYSGEDNPFSMGTVRQANCVSGKPGAFARWTPSLSGNERMCIYISYKSFSNSSACARYTVYHRGGKSEYVVNQRIGGGTWIFLGEFDLGPDSYVTLDNGTPSGRKFVSGSIVTADALKFGGGIGKILRGSGISDVPSYLEGAMYWEQWAGMPYERIHQWPRDYTCDFASRGEWVKMMKDDKGIPFDMSLAFHTDAGVTPNDSTVGTLSIYTLKADGKRKFKSGEDRAACRLLADYVQSQIVDDLRQDYDSLWTRRGLWNRSYSESRTTDVPAMLLELLSHQNFSDMKFGLDPAFRFDACRAVYKGILKFLSTYYGERYEVAPLPVESFSALLDEGGKVSLSWTARKDVKEPTAEPDGYMVYTRIDDGAFDAGRLTRDCKLEVEISPGHVYSFMVEAYNRGGRSFPSEILSVGMAGNNARKILIINNFDRISAPSWFDSEKYAGFDARLDSGVPYIKDISYAGESYEYRREKKYVNNVSPGFGGCEVDMAGFQAAGNTFDYPSVHGRIFLEAGYSFCSSSRKAFERMPQADYHAIDVICGKQIGTIVGKIGSEVRYRVYPESFRNTLSTFMAAGTNILISGAYIATDAWDEVYPIEDEGYQKNARSFIADELGFKWSTTRGSSNGVFEIDGVKYSFCSELNDSIYCVETAGGIRAAGKNARIIGKYSNRTGAGVYYPAENYKVVAWSFPLETISDHEQMKEIFNKSLKYFE